MKTSMMIRPLLFLLLSALPAAAQNPPVAPVDTAYVPGQYRVFTGAGQPATMDDVVRAMGRTQVLFVGETHDDPTGHMLELVLLQRGTDAYAAGGAGGAGAAARPLALSLEFFERDAQLPLDEYLAGAIPESSFRADARPWARYQTDYRPLVEFAKEHNLPVIAANAPRRYVSMVTRRGRESLNALSPQALAYLPPLPYGKASPAYRNRWIATIAEVMEQEGKKCGVAVADAAAPMGSHQNMGNQLDGQVLWDATMAHSVSRFLAARPGVLVLHMVGGFHVERGNGIADQLKSYTPNVSTMVVSLRPVDNVDRFEPAPNGQWGDFVIQTDKSHTLESIECRKFLSERAVK